MLNKPPLRYRRWLCLMGITSVALLAGIASLITVRLAMAYHQAPSPQAILTLGGGSNRERFTAYFAQSHPNLDIWVSSGTENRQARIIFDEAGILEEQVYLDRRAIDTVTNFTSLVSVFKARNIQHLYLITSDYHMPRAKAIATLVLGSRGIAFTPVPIPSDEPPEPWLLILRDTARAMVWVVSGHTGASLSPRSMDTPSKKPDQNTSNYGCFNNYNSS